MSVLRVRYKDGQVDKLDNVALIEILSGDKLFGLIQIQDNKIAIYEPGDIAFSKYARLIRKEEATLVNINPNKK